MKEIKKEQHSFQIQQEKGESKQQCLARNSINPLVLSAMTISDYSPLPENDDLNALVTVLEDQAGEIKNGNLDRIEEMLVAQAHTLDAISTHLFRRAIIQEYIGPAETYLKLGLRAQAQCRSNAEALANMKNPRTHLNQTNIAHNQQINNVQSELLEEIDGERLDFGKAATPIRGDTTLETVGKQHRAKDS